MAVTVIAEVHAREGLADQLRESLQQGREVALGSEGCESFEVFVGIDDPNRFYMLERWTSEELHAKHFEEKVAPYLENYKSLLDRPFQEGGFLNQPV